MAREIKAKIKITADTKQADRELDKVTKSTKGLAAGFTALKAGILVAAAAFTGLIVFIKNSIEAFNEQELAVEKLDNTLASLGQRGESLSLRLQALASDMQKVSNFGDEVTISAIAQIAAFTKDEAAIRELTKASADLAAGQGISLASAAQLVARSFATSTNALTRQGVETDALAGSTERLFDITQGVANLYGGQALAAANTLSGAQTRFGNAIGDTSELLGEYVAEVTQLQRLLVVLATSTEKANEPMEEQPSIIQRGVNVIKDWIRVGVPFGNTMLRLAGIADTKYNKALENQEEILGIVTAKTKRQIAALDRLNVTFLAVTERIQAFNTVLGVDLPTSIENSRAELAALGTVFESDVNREIARNNGLLEQAAFLYDKNQISLSSYRSAQEAVSKANDALRESLEPVVIETREYDLQLGRTTRSLEFLTAAEIRNADLTVESSLRRTAARAAESDAAANILGGESDFAQIGGGTFFIPDSTQAGTNGRIRVGIFGGGPSGAGTGIG